MAKRCFINAPGALAAPDQDAGDEDQGPAEDNLDDALPEAHIEVFVADEGDDDELDADHHVGKDQRQMEAGEQEGKGVADAADEGHTTGDEAADQWVAAAGQL